MSRYYDFPGDERQYVSVTTFLDVASKPFLIPWAAKMERELIRLLIEKGEQQGRSYDEVVDELKSYIAPKRPYGFQLYTESRADIGAVVHKAIDYYLKGLKLPRMKKDEKRIFAKWLDWWEEQGYRIEGAERVVKHPLLGYAGTLDALVAGGPSDPLVPQVIDWKTGKGSYPEHILQNYAYQEALKFEEIETLGGLLVYIPSQPDELDKPIYTKRVDRVTPELMKKVEAYLELWRIVNNKPWKEAA